MSNKKSRRKRNPKPQKQARFDIKLATQNKKLIWEVSKIDAKGQWGWDKIDGSYFLMNIWKKMRNFETMTWGDILGRDHHMIAVRDIIKPAQRRLQELKYDDVEELASFHVNGMQRLWAIRLGNMSSLLWWDPNHEICPSHKKHT